MFTLILFVSSLISCSKDEPVFPASTPTATTEKKAPVVTVPQTPTTTTPSNLIFEENFEGTNIWPGLHRQFGTSWAFNVSSEKVFRGTKSGRFELRDTDPMTSNGTRSEVLFPQPDQNHRWYSYSVYFPSDKYKMDSNSEIISQWHQGGGISPSLCFRTKKDRFLVQMGTTLDNRKTYDLGGLTKDVWHSFVFHVIHSHGTDGLLEVWHNGVKKLNYRGGTMYDSELPRWKVGIYKDDWNGSETTDTNLRVLYFDNIKVGNAKATLEEMMPENAGRP